MNSAGFKTLTFILRSILQWVRIGAHRSYSISSLPASFCISLSLALSLSLLSHLIGDAISSIARYMGGAASHTEKIS